MKLTTRSKRLVTLAVAIIFFYLANAQNYPQNYFRHPLNIPMQLVANFGEIRTNHWHMGLDIRTQQKVNVPVYAAAAGFISRVVVEPGGFGQAIYIDHPDGFTTLYAHLNSFYPELAAYVREQQYAQQSWKINLVLPSNKFGITKGGFIGLSGSTGGSAGPHVHFEIRNTETEKCLNPLLFKFPIADAVPPTITRLALYNRNLSTYSQQPQLLLLKKIGGYYTTATSPAIKVGSNKISFAIGATDRFTGSNNPNGIYSAKILVDDKPIAGFVHDNIGYDETRFINAQIDYPYEARAGRSLQHISPLPGATGLYNVFSGDGLIYLNDTVRHQIMIEVLDANQNRSEIKFTVQYDAALSKPLTGFGGERFLPNNVNVYESGTLELFTTEQTIYDTVAVTHSVTTPPAVNAASALHNFLSAAIPAHDSVTVRIKTTMELSNGQKERLVIKNTSGTRTFVQKARWQNGWATAKFRQFGSYQVFIDDVPPTVNAPLPNLSKAARIVFVPKDNFNTIKKFRVELDGQWLRFSNDKGRSWIYNFDEKFTRGEHELKVTVEDEAGNVMEKVWMVRR